MLEFPRTTEFGRKVPKQKFYDNADIPAPIRRLFVEEIEGILWRNKFSSSTLNVEQGVNVTEIELLQLTLRQKSISKPVLETIANAIPYHLIFLLEYMEKYQLSVAYSRPNGKPVWYSTQWQPYDALLLQVQGLNLDNIYENFVRQIAGENLVAGESLQADVERESARNALQKRIFALSRKLRAEKQFNRQVAINRELRAVKAELAELEY